jgi:hypothetical protein
MNGAGLESGERTLSFNEVPNPGGLYHSGNILGCFDTICDGILMLPVGSGAKRHTPTFETSCELHHLE